MSPAVTHTHLRSVKGGWFARVFGKARASLSCDCWNPDRQCRKRREARGRKLSDSKREQTNIHLYPYWAASQEQSDIHLYPNWPVMKPYEVPYSMIYSPEVFYAHPAVPLTAPVSTQLFLLESMGQGITKMLDRLDRVDMQIVDGTHEVDGEGSINGASRSAEGWMDASSNRSDSHTSQSQGESTSMGKQNADRDVEVNTQANSTAEGDANVASIDSTGITVAPEKPVDTSNGKSETGMTRSASFAVAGLPLKASLQKQQQLKRERRKQANRESACRSRLKKQAEVDELMKRYETVKVENTALKSEINQLTEELKKLKDENCALMEKLNGAEVTYPRAMVLDETRRDSSTQPNCSEDGFMLNNSVSFVIGIN